MTVLIIESSLLISGRIKNLLLEKKQGIIIYQSVGHRKAARLLEKTNPDIVLMDMYLQGTMELLKKIQESYTQTTAVALVNREDNDKQLKCKAAGADFIFDMYHEFEALPRLIDRKDTERNLKPGSEKPKYYPEFA